MTLVFFKGRVRRQDPTEVKAKRLRLALIAYLAMFAVTEVLRLSVQGAHFELAEGVDWVFSTFTQIFGMYGIPLLIIFLPECRTLTPKVLAAELGYRSTVKWWVYLLAVVIGLLAPIVSVGVSFVFNMIFMFTGMWFPPVSTDLTNSAWAMIGAVFFTAVLPAVCEEGLHRGILVRALRPHYKDTSVILLTALFFSLMHSYIRQTFFTFAFGIVTGFMVVKTGSMWVAMIAHFVNNAYLTIGDYITQFNWWGSGFTDAMDGVQTYLLTHLSLGIFVWVLTIAVIGVMLYMMARFGKRRRDDSRMFDAAAGQRPANGRMLTRTTPNDRVWLYTAILAGLLLTLLSYFQYSL